MTPVSILRSRSTLLPAVALALLILLASAPLFALGSAEEAEGPAGVHQSGPHTPGESPARDASGTSDSPALPDPGDRDAALPFNPEVASGRLANGLMWYALEHPRPEGKLVLRLAVDAGSVLETESQRGLAHFVEHMAFNGTESFGEDELVAYLESLGIRFGPDVNAYTSFDETVYQLEIPTEDPEALQTGFQVMREWASAVTFAPEAIERERGIIVEEWRGGLNANRRMLEQHIPTLLADSQYAIRLPIGDMDVVRTAPRSAFVDFYDRWYRPDNMAFIAVGDMPTEEIERLITETFAPIARPATPLQRPYFHVPPSGGTRVSIAADAEAARSTVSIYVLDSPLPFETIDDYRNLLVRALFTSIMNERFREIARDPDAPITGGGMGFNRFLRSLEIAVSSAVVRDDAVEPALQLLVDEIERARRFGVLEDELARARMRFMQAIEESVVNAATRPGATLADELVRHWLEGEAVPGIAFEAELYETLLPTISVAEVSSVAELFARAEDRVVLASVRDTGAALPSAERLEMIVAGGTERTLARPASQTVPDELLTSEPVPGSTVARADFPAVETTELTLSNGMRVFVRPSELSEDEILFSAYSPGGLALVDPADIPAARLAASVAGGSGLGTLDAGALERALSGRSASISAAIGRVSEQMNGSARREDLSLLFQLIRLTITEPRFEERALQNARNQAIEAIRSAAASPQGQFSRAVQEQYGGGDPTLAPLTIEQIEAVSLAQIEAVYADRFARPDDLALFFAGSVSVEEIRELAERYLAGIGPQRTDDPALADGGQFVETVPPPRVGRPEGVITETVAAGREPVGQFFMLLHGPYEFSRENNQRLNSLADYLDIRLREEIREAQGGAYSIGAGAFRWGRPIPWYYLQIVFGTDPGRIDELRTRVIAILEEARATPPSTDYVERIKAQQLDQYRQSINENSYWLSVLSFAVEHGRDLNEIVTFPELIESLDGEEIQRMAAEYLDLARRIEIRLVPAEE